ncbi:MAG: hypothetical protein J5I91_01335 [Bacteroidetes bacterium]|nr:hypothetical protein [Bacteroidota bacterium]
MTKTLTVLITLACILISCGQNQSKTDNVRQDWKTIEESQFKIQYPQDWELNQNGAMGSTFVLFAPNQGSSSQFRTNINLMIQDLSDLNMDLNEFVNISEEQILEIIPNATMIESKRVKSGNEEYHNVEFTADQNNYHLRFVQRYWVKNMKAFVLTVTVEDSAFSQFKETVESILNTFELK